MGSHSRVLDTANFQSACIWPATTHNTALWASSDIHCVSLIAAQHQHIIPVNAHTEPNVARALCVGVTQAKHHHTAVFEFAGLSPAEPARGTLVPGAADSDIFEDPAAKTAAPRNVVRRTTSRSTAVILLYFGVRFTRAGVFLGSELGSSLLDPDVFSNLVDVSHFSPAKLAALSQPSDRSGTSSHAGAPHISQSIGLRVECTSFSQHLHRK